MTRLLTLLFLLFVSASCNRNIVGTYRHKICDIGPNCFIITFKKDRSFEYKYFQDILGRGIINGKYLLDKDTARLTITKDTTELKSYFKTYLTTDTILKIKVYNAFGNREMSSIGGRIILNDTIHLKLDFNGETNYKIIPVNTIKVSVLMNEQLRDSVYMIKTNDNNIDIHTVTIPTMETWMTKIYLKKGKRIYPLQFEPEQVLLSKNNYLKKSD